MAIDIIERYSVGVSVILLDLCMHKLCSNFASNFHRRLTQYGAWPCAKTVCHFCVDLLCYLRLMCRKNWKMPALDTVEFKIRRVCDFITDK